MGVPKFYRWISERYPCLSQVVRDYQIPEFDNLYLDMNGIIHNCSHPNDDDPTFRISEEKIFSDIFRYLEALFRIIKPQKVMVLAVDGVAPRAKMNQQRGRRFRSAREAEDLVRKALQKGQVLPSEARFDSNCITPGTEFMARLHEHLKYFIANKLSSDPTWQKVEVILSGHDVPGEGEHKIMDYIRHAKAQPNYNPNTRHCLYGLDADLIMLGLLSHEPHFSLLREEVVFGRKSQKKQSTPDTITFHLLHLSIMREYLDFEFGCLKEKLTFGYDVENVIDDWVLMGFLVGNDFLPNLPNLHIGQEALPFLYSKYIEVLPTLGGYINDGGTLNMARFEVYMKAISQFDVDHYSELFDDMKWLEGKSHVLDKKRSKNKRDTSDDSTSDTDRSGLGSHDDTMFPAGLADFAAGCGQDEIDGDKESAETQKLKRDFGIPNLQSYFNEEDKDLDKNFHKEFVHTKANYYKDKMGFVHVDERVLVEQAKCYVVGIQWVLHYYYTGVPSWSWFYPYHYAPYMSDVRGFSDMVIQFELGTPFKPFEQLLAVLPPASKSLLPKAFQTLMINEDSPVKDFYPVSFETDLNGKQHEWEAVVLIPFIDEDRLLQAMISCYTHLTHEETTRNEFGMCLVSTFDASAVATVYPSPWPQVFSDLTHYRVKYVQLPPNPFPVDKDNVVLKLCKDVKLDVYFPGFPSLKHVKHTGRLEKKGVRVFQMASRGDNLFLTLSPPRKNVEGLAQVAQVLIGKTVYVDWPYLVEARVSAVSDGNERYYQTGSPAGRKSHDQDGCGLNIRSEQLHAGGAKQWREEKTIISRRYLEHKGIDIGNVEIIVYAQVLQGKRYIMNKGGAKGTVCLFKEWSSISEPFVYQTVVRDIAAFAPEYAEQATTLAELYPAMSQCFIMSSPHYGALAEVVSVDMVDQVRVHVKVQLDPEPNFDAVMDNHQLSVRYFSSHQVAEKVGLSTIVLSRLTGNILVERGSRNNSKPKDKVKIGLNWKFTKRNQEILGYAHKQEGGGWSFSPVAIKLLQEFIKQFPAMFHYITSYPKEDIYYEQDLFPYPDGPESVRTVKEWLKKLPSEGVDSVDCGGLSLDKPQIDAIEKALCDMQKLKPGSGKTVKLKVKPTVLFKPIDHQRNLIPDPSADFMLFDRVVNVSTTTAVPFALKGTITGIMGESRDNSPILYEILFDEVFLGGLKLRCSSNRAYRLPASCLLSISYGTRIKETKKEQRTYTRPGTEYASVASSQSKPPPHNYRVNYEGASSHRHPGHRGYDSPDYHRSRARSDHGNKDPVYKNESSRNPKDVHGKGKAEGGKGKADGGKGDTRERTILKRGSSKESLKTSSVEKATETSRSHDYKSTVKTGDDFSAAVNALSTLNISPYDDESSPSKSTNQRVGHGRELSPSVTAVFDAHEKQEALSGSRHAEQGEPRDDHSTNLKNILGISSSELPSSVSPPEAPEREMPDAIHKLMGPPVSGQPRGPLLPVPPFPHSQPRSRGPLLPRLPNPPLFPYGPPAMDPLGILYHTTYSLGYPQPRVSSRKTRQGYLGSVEIGQKKYVGLMLPTSKEAELSAAAIANADLHNTKGSLLGYYSSPYQAPYPLIPPPLPRYDGPLFPYYPNYGPPPMSYSHPQWPLSNPVASSQGYSAKPRWGGAGPTLTFVPLQVQMKQTVKSLPTDENSNQQSSPDQQTLETAKRDILKSLNITSQGTSGENPIDSAGTEELAKRVKGSLESIRTTQDKVNRLSGILNAVSATPDVLSADQGAADPVPVEETGNVQPQNPFHTGDLILHAALSEDLDEPQVFTKELTEPVQVTDPIAPAVGAVVIAGEIVGGPSYEDTGDESSSKDSHRQEDRISNDSPNACVSTDIPNDITGTVNQSAQVVTPSKRQLAVSFPK